MEGLESALPEDQTVDYGFWKDEAAKIDEGILKSQNELEPFDVDVKDYESVKKVEGETQVSE